MRNIIPNSWADWANWRLGSNRGTYPKPTVPEGESEDSDMFEEAKSILHHLHIDDRHPGNGPSKIFWSHSGGGHAVLVADLASVKDLSIGLYPTSYVLGHHGDAVVEEDS